MRFLAFFFVFVPILIDYFSKKFIEKKFALDDNPVVFNDYVVLEKVYNKGMAFGLFDSDSPLTNIFFSIVVIFIIIYLINYVFKYGASFNKPDFFAFHIIIGGAIANLIDRLSNGKVLDFIIIHYENIYFPAIFNFADAFITLGIFIIITNWLIHKHD
tara:strand:+ start:68 stop:541 length:474 start_codon:yes stop_codon:yes gene_type:complete